MSPAGLATSSSGPIGRLGRSAPTGLFHPGGLDPEGWRGAGPRGDYARELRSRESGSWTSRPVRVAPLVLGLRLTLRLRRFLTRIWLPDRPPEAQLRPYPSPEDEHAEEQEHAHKGSEVAHDVGDGEWHRPWRYPHQTPASRAPASRPKQKRTHELSTTPVLPGPPADRAAAAHDRRRRGTGTGRGGSERRDRGRWPRPCPRSRRARIRALPRS